jgi:hypothetical protein
MNAYRAGHICLSVRVIQFENRWADLDEIWYGLYAIGVYPEIVPLNVLRSVIPTWRTNKLVRWVDTSATWLVGWLAGWLVGSLFYGTFFSN